MTAATTNPTKTARTPTIVATTARAATKSKMPAATTATPLPGDRSRFHR